MDFRSRILAAIDRLQAGAKPVTADSIADALWPGITTRELTAIPRELRAMSKAGIVVYDRKASGWRRA